MGSVWGGTLPAKNVGAIHNQKSEGHNDFGRCSKGDAAESSRARKNSNCCGTAMTCASMAHYCAMHTMLGSQAIGKSSLKITDSKHGQERR